jgi:vitamin B12 transporter
VQSGGTRFERDTLGGYAAAGTSADAVLRQAEGVQVQHYGGHGGVRTLSLRGFAPNQTAVTFDGVPYQNAQLGVVNFAHFFPEAYSAITVTHRAHNPDINPLGGSVNFETRPTRSGSMVQAGAGSFGERLLVVRTARCRPSYGVLSGFSRVSAQDDYPFVLNGTTGLRQHAQFATTQLFNTGAVTRGLWELRYFAHATRSAQNVPDAVVTGSGAAQRDSLAQGDMFVYAKARRALVGRAGSYVQVLAATHLNTLRYHTQPLVQRYESRDYLAQASGQHVWARHLLKASAQLQRDALVGNNLAIAFRPVAQVRRTQLNVGAAHSWQRGGWLVESIVRANYVRPYGLLPNGGCTATWAHVRTRSRTEAFAHTHAGVRVPAFNELYYFGYGNSDLKPEQSRSIEAGAMHAFTGKTWATTLKITPFANQTRNKIIAIPINPVQWSTFSIGAVRTLGLSASGEVRLGDWLAAYGTYTLQRATDRTTEVHPLLPYTPVETATYGVQWGRRRIKAFVNGQYVGWRFALLSNTRSSLLPAYHVVDAGLRYEQPLGRRLRILYTAQATNLTDTRYEVIRSYPMPPRAVQGRLALLF